MPRAASALASRELAARSWPKVQLRTLPSAFSTISASASRWCRSHTARPMLKRSGRSSGTAASLRRRDRPRGIIAVIYTLMTGQPAIPAASGPRWSRPACRSRVRRTRASAGRCRSGSFGCRGWLSCMSSSSMPGKLARWKPSRPLGEMVRSTPPRKAMVQAEAQPVVDPGRKLALAEHAEESRSPPRRVRPALRARPRGCDLFCSSAWRTVSSLRMP